MTDIGNQVITSARDIFGMYKQKEYTVDMEAHYKLMLNYLDILNYMNSNSFDPPIATRHTIAYLACAMPSLAYIDPSRTREISYNLSLVCRNILSPLLKHLANEFNSENMLLVEVGFADAVYRMVSGKDMFDENFHRHTKALYDIFIYNQESKQQVCMIDTIRGRYEVYPSLMALMALEIHDKIFGTDYACVKDGVLSSIHRELQEKESGLFYTSYQTGALGYPKESVSKEASWKIHSIELAANAGAITFLHYYEPEVCEKLWPVFKERFTPELLAMTTEELCDGVEQSFTTQLAPATEGYLFAMAAAREMKDESFFDQLQKHLMDISGPMLSEGHIFYNDLGDNQHLIAHFIFFSRAHEGWSTLFAHPWEQFYGMDYNKVR